MREEVLENLKNISKSDSKELEELLQSDIDIKEYIISEYNKLMEEWKQTYQMFDIPSGMISICINGETKYYNIGKNHYDENTIFDIASMTKLYTEFVLFDFLEEYNLTLNSKIGEISSNYENLKDMTLMDILNFKNTYKTTIDMRECTNKEEALKALRTIYVVPEKEGYYLYTDLPIMVLTDIMETYSGKSYKELFNKYIIQKYNLTDTYLDINTTERYVTLNKNLVNDPKANIMGGYYGHGGVKATSRDFIKFLNSALDSKHIDLFITPSEALDPETNKKISKKALIGNLNLSTKKDDSLASRYLPSEGFAIQGSVRCHGETARFIVDNKEYVITTSIFLDLYTQLDNILKYENETNKTITKEYEVDEYGKLIMCDVRSLLSYKGTYKELTNLVGKCRTIELYRYIKEIIRRNYSM